MADYALRLRIKSLGWYWRRWVVDNVRRLLGLPVWPDLFEHHLIVTNRARQGKPWGQHG